MSSRRRLRLVNRFPRVAWELPVVVAGAVPSGLDRPGNPGCSPEMCSPNSAPAVASLAMRPLGWLLSVSVGDERCGELSPAPDADLVEHGGQVLLDCVGGDVQLADDLAGGLSLQDQCGDAHLRWCEAVSTKEQGAEAGPARLARIPPRSGVRLPHLGGWRGWSATVRHESGHERWARPPGPAAVRVCSAGPLPRRRPGAARPRGVSRGRRSQPASTQPPG